MAHTAVCSQDLVATRDRHVVAAANAASKASVGAYDIAAKRLCAAFNEVRRRCADVPVIAIHWMSLKHPIHPVHRQLLQVWASPARGPRGLLAIAQPVRDCLAWAARVVRSLIWAFGLSLTVLWMRWFLHRQRAVLERQRMDVVAVTWCFDCNRTRDDFYYGDLQRRLSQRGIRMLLLCGDGRRLSLRPRHWMPFAKAYTVTGDPPRLPVLAVIPPSAPLRLFGAQWRCSWKLWWAAWHVRDRLLRSTLRAAARDCVAPQTTENALFFFVGQEAVARWRPRAVMSLYEANSWEQCFWRGGQVADPSCRLIGYQHTVIMPYSRSLIRPHEEHPWRVLPDIVLCLGEATRRLLTEGHAGHGSALVLFGSFRYLDQGGTSHAPAPQTRTVLVLPEGILSEATFLFDLAMRLAPRLPDHRFIFRCHPVLPLTQVREHLADAPERFPNIVVSDQAAITADLARSSSVLYRGSSAVLYAVLHGLKPFYVRRPGEPDVDPLFTAQGWREQVESPDELEQALRRYAAVQPATALAKWREAVDHVNAQTHPVDAQAVDDLIDAIRVGHGGLV